MKRYKVEIKEIWKKIMMVEAENEEEAKSIVAEEAKTGEFCVAVKSYSGNDNKDNLKMEGVGSVEVLEEVSIDGHRPLKIPIEDLKKCYEKARSWKKYADRKQQENMSWEEYERGQKENYVKCHKCEKTFCLLDAETASLYLDENSRTLYTCLECNGGKNE